MRSRFVSAFALASAICCASPLWAQVVPGTADGAAGGTARLKEEYGAAEFRRDFRQLDLKADEAAKIQGLLERDKHGLDLARAGIRELQARLARLLLDEKPDMPEIQKTVRQSLEAEYTIRMVQIQRTMALREILGDKRWASLTRMARATAFLAKRSDLKELAERTGDSEKLGLLLEILKSLQ